MKYAAENSKIYKFRANKINVYVLKEEIFKTVLDNAEFEDGEIVEFVKRYIKETSNIEKARLKLAKDTEVSLEADLTEEVTIEESMDPNGNEYVLETPTVKKYKAKLECYLGDNIYQLEQLFTSTKVYKTENGGFGISANNKSVNSLDKGNVIVIENKATGTFWVGYKFVPSSALPVSFKNKDTQSYAIELTQVAGLKDRKFFNNILEEISDSDFAELPTFTV